MVEIGLVEVHGGGKSVDVVEDDLALLECQHSILAELTKYTIDVNRGQSQGVGQHVLREGARVTLIRRKADELEPCAKFQQEMGGALKSVPASDADEVLDHHCFIP